MKNNKKLPVLFLICMIASVALLTLTTINGARAAIGETSDDYTSELSIREIGVDLTSKTFFSGEASDLEIGKKVSDSLTVKNTGKMNEYVRLVIYKYWIKDDESTTKASSSVPEKRTDLDPGMIKVEYVLGKGWNLYQETADCIIIYYSPILGGSEDLDENGELIHDSETVPVTLSYYIKSDVKKDFTFTESKDESTGITTRNYEYKYNGAKFYLEVEADGVQTHNADKAVISAWGARGASINGENLVIPQKGN